MNSTANPERSPGESSDPTCRPERRSYRRRGTLHPILHSRIGPDQFVSRMARLREDARFRAVQPESFDQDSTMQPLDPAAEDELDDTLELWFDWAFVDFWKNHYCEPSLILRFRLSWLWDGVDTFPDTIQRSIAIDPDAVRGSTSELPLLILPQIQAHLMRRLGRRWRDGSDNHDASTKVESSDRASDAITIQAVLTRE